MTDKNGLITICNQIIKDIKLGYGKKHTIHSLESFKKAIKTSVGR